MTATSSSRWPSSGRHGGTRSRSPVGSRFGVLALTAVTGFALLPAPTPGAVTSAQAPRPQFATSVTTVRVDTIVTDADGRFVTGLGRDDFRVYEDGVLQELLDVELVELGPDGPGSGVVLAPDAATPGAAPAAMPPDTAVPSDTATPPDAARPSTESDLGTLVFLIDGLSLGTPVKARFAETWSSLLAQTSHVAAPRAAYLIDNVGRLEEIAPLTRDVERLRSAAERVERLPSIGTSVLERMSELAQDLEDADLQQIVEAKARMFEREERNRSLQTLRLLTQFCDALAARPGRTALVWVSMGVKLTQSGPYQALVSGAGGDGAGARSDVGMFNADSQLTQALEELNRAANSANVSLYPVDPNLVGSLRSAGSDVAVQNHSMAVRMRSPFVQRSLDGLRDVMRVTAEETGGRALIGWGDLDEALLEVERDTGRFYLLSYRAPAPEGDGEYHEIRVEVEFPGADVRARRGYTDYPAAERATRRLNAALALPGTVDGLPFAAEVVRSWRPDGSVRQMLSLAVEAAELATAIDGDGNVVGSLQVHGFVQKGDGDPVAELHDIVSARLRRDENETMGAAAPDPFGFLVYRKEWDLEPGEHTLRVAVLDELDGRIGAEAIELDTRAGEGGSWAASDLLLVAGSGDDELQPVVGGRILAGQTVALYAEVLDGARPIISGRVFASERASEEDVERSARIHPLPLRRVGQRQHRGSLPFPPFLPPGQYVLQVQITDEPAAAHRIFRLPIEVIQGPV